MGPIFPLISAAQLAAILDPGNSRRSKAWTQSPSDDAKPIPPRSLIPLGRESCNQEGLPPKHCVY